MTQNFKHDLGQVLDSGLTKMSIELHPSSVVSEKQRLQFLAACSGANQEAPMERWDHNWDGRDPKAMVKPPREFHAEDADKMAEWSEKESLQTQQH